MLVAAAFAGTTVVVSERGTIVPVQRATVSVGETSCETDARGRCSLELRGDSVALWVVAEGFESRTVEVRGTARRVRVPLRRAATATYEVVVQALRPSSHGSRQIVDAEVALETPGNHEDAVRLVQSLPGVSVQREYSPSAGTLSVRGSAAGDNRYFLDGIEVPYLYHYNQYASVFGVSQLSSLELYASGQGPAYGDVVGAVVEARSRLDPPDAVHGGVGLNFVMGSAHLTAPVGKEWWVSASGRRSYLDLAGEQTAQFPVWPRFFDYALRAHRGDGDNGTGAFVWGAGDAYTRAAAELDLLDSVEADQAAALDYQQGFQVAGATHRFTTPTVHGALIGAYVHHRRLAALSAGGAEDLADHGGHGRLDLRVTPSQSVVVETGAELRGSSTSLRADGRGGYERVEVAAEAPALASGEVVDGVLPRLRVAGYGTAHWLTGPVRWIGGARVGGDSAGGGALLEPRAAVHWRAAPQTALRVGGGRYLQRPDSAHLFEATGSPDLPTTTAWQLSVGVEQTIAGRLELALEAYDKWLRDPIATPLDGPAAPADKGRSRGVELSSGYRLRELFFVRAWAGLAESVLEDGGLERPSDGDQRFALGLVTAYTLGNFDLGARFRYATGLPYTPIEGSIYDAGRDAWSPQAGDDNAARMPIYAKLDLRLAHTWTLPTWSLTLSAEVWVVPPSAAQLYPTWNYDYSEQGWVVGPTVLPLLGARATF
jgi:hypothetical protein